MTVSHVTTQKNFQQIKAIDFSSETVNRFKQDTAVPRSVLYQSVTTLDCL